MDDIRKQIKKKKINKEKIRIVIQLSYIFIFIFSAIGICGNIELGVETSIYSWFVFIVSGVLTFGKIIYVEIKRRKQDARKNK